MPTISSVCADPMLSSFAAIVAGDALTSVVPSVAAETGANVVAGVGAAIIGTDICASLFLAGSSDPLAKHPSRAASSAGVLVSSGVSSKPRLRIQRPTLLRLVSIVNGTDRTSPDRIGIIHQMYRGAISRMAAPQINPSAICHL